MVTLKHTLIFFFLLSQFCFAQWFEIENLPTTANLKAVHFISNDTGWIAGKDLISDHGIILKTTDHTQTYTAFYADSGICINAIQFTNSNIGWAVGDSGLVYHTTDGGTSWLKQISGTNERINNLFFLNNYLGWIVTDAYPSSEILLTTNGGENWICKSSVPVMGTSIFFIDNNLGWCSINGGVGKNLESTGYGDIMKTTDGGNNWLQISTDNVNSLYFVNKDTGWAAGFKPELFGGKGMIIKSIDGGNNWEIKKLIEGSKFNDIYFLNEDIGCAVGTSGVILVTTDGGENWIEQISGVSDLLFSVHLVDQNEGWIAGLNVLLYTPNCGGVSFVEEHQFDEVPTEFLISQNYPNPFNPSTNIDYSIPQSSNVELKVFDILGNEIETLVSEEKPAGTYEITWYAEQLPSGVYFYQLKAGSFVETKKMLLLK